MKKLYTFLAAILLTATTFAQTPEKMSYQAVVRDSGDALVTNQAVGMQISILQTTATGTAVYVETQTPTTNVNGLVTLEIGTGSVVSGDFTTIDWSADSYFIKTETDPAGGTTYTITGTSQLMSVPYALYAKTSGSATPGPQGAQGAQGADGAAGLDGATGATGAAGTNGTDGTQGIQGATGTSGADGATGAQGPAGNDGATGPQGLAGNDGATGLTGPQGPVGPTGPTGPAGSLGPQGIPGADGVGIAQTLSFASPNLALSDGGGSIDLTDIINATHTGDVTGATALTIATNAVTTDKIKDNNVTDAKIVAVSASKISGTVSVANGGTNITTFTPGDILYATSATELTKLPAGTAGQVLTMNTGATAPEWVAATTATYTVNTSYPELGGYVIEINTDGTHGLVVARQDQGTSTWYVANDLLSNAANHNANGAMFKDWRLPTKRELNLMYTRRMSIGLFDLSGNAPSYSNYWSSTEDGYYIAWRQRFNDGNQYGSNKANTNFVRAVRAF
jgi:hypothetical protein